MSPDNIILVLNAASTLLMVGMVWFVQIVHYPLFASVGTEHFNEFHFRHQKRAIWVVGAPMLVEALSSVLLVWYAPPVTSALPLLGVGLLFIIWVSTAFLQFPCHSDLQRGFDTGFHRQLVLTNWLRTVCWSLRGLLVCWFVIATLTHQFAA